MLKLFIKTLEVSDLQIFGNEDLSSEGLDSTKFQNEVVVLSTLVNFQLDNIRSNYKEFSVPIGRILSNH